MQLQRPEVLRYAVAVLTTGLADCVWALAGTRLEPSPFPLLCAAGAISAWYGGLGAGVMATSLGLISCLSIYVPNAYSRSDGLQQYGLQLLVFAVTMGLITSLYAARQRAERAAAHQALHDPLTGLPNRRLFQDRLDQLLMAGQRTRSPFALILIDLDDFKEVNDTLGHLQGDSLLAQFAQRLRAHLRAADTVARLGGDEFALLFPDTDELGTITAMGRLIQLLREPFSLGGTAITIRASMGLALYPDHGTTHDDLFTRADTMLYAVKRGEVSEMLAASGELEAPEEQAADAS
jgi:diguanylate cyclase (GGDEF)-like protein